MPLFLCPKRSLKKSVALTRQCFLQGGKTGDICWRVRLYGYTVEVEPRAFFYHDSFCITQDIKDYRTNTRETFLENLMPFVLCLKIIVSFF